LIVEQQRHGNKISGKHQSRPLEMNMGTDLSLLMNFDRNIEQHCITRTTRGIATFSPSPNVNPARQIG
jgi:hypothetical protein